MNEPFRVGEWLVQPLNHQIEGPEAHVKIDPRVMRLLVCLARQAPETVSREELIAEVWDGSFVNDDVLTQSVSELRKALKDDPKEPRFVTTVPKRGYRLIAPVETSESEEPPVVGATTPARRRLGARERTAWLLVAGLIGLIAWVSFSSQRSRRPTAPVRIAIAPPPATSTETLRISPDGRWIAFIVPDEDGVGRVWVHEIETGVRKTLEETESPGHLFWSPDSQWIGFSTATKLQRVSVTGGKPETIWEQGFWWGGSWSERDELILSQFGHLYRMDASGSEPERFEPHDGQRHPVRIRPFSLPGGRNVLYFAAPEIGPGALYVASLDTGEAARLVESDSRGIYADGHLLFVRGNALMAQPFDLWTLRVDGEARVIDKQLVSPAVVGRTDAPFSASNDGTLVYRGESGVDGQLVWFDRRGRELHRVPQPAAGEYVNPSLSPDGKTIAANRRDPATGNIDIYLIDVDTHVTTRLSSAATPELDAIWSPDGERIAFASVRDGRHEIWVKNVVGGEETRVYAMPREKPGSILLTDWSSDGENLLAFAGGDTWIIPLDSEGEPRLVLEDTFSDGGKVRVTHMYCARFSPDGLWIAFASNETGDFEIYVMRASDGSHRRRLSAGGGVFPTWRADSRELYYWGSREFHGPVMKVELDYDGGGLSASQPERLFEPIIAGLLDSRTNYAVTADGERFLLRRPTGERSPVHVVVNWTALLSPH